MRLIYWFILSDHKRSPIVIYMVVILRGILTPTFSSFPLSPHFFFFLSPTVYSFDSDHTPIRRRQSLSPTLLRRSPSPPYFQGNSPSSFPLFIFIFFQFLEKIPTPPPWPVLRRSMLPLSTAVTPGVTPCDAYVSCCGPPVQFLSSLFFFLKRFF